MRIRGTNPNIKIRFLELDNKNHQHLLCKFFPEYNLHQINEELDEMASKIYKHYRMVFI